MGYPLGGANGLSTVTFLLFLIGVWRLWRRRQHTLLVLCLGPFVLGFLAALLQRYPYGGCWRLSQHVAPSICLLAGLGTAVLIDRVRSAASRERCITVVCGLLALSGGAGMLWNLLHPYRGDVELWLRQVVQQIVARSSPNDQIVVLNRERDTDVVFNWYLSRFRGHVAWEGRLDTGRLRDTTGQVWCLNLGGDAAGLENVKERLNHSGRSWVLAQRVPYTIIPSLKSVPILRCEVYRWINMDNPHCAAPSPPLSCWP
jgi:hypothetical protein